jgi:hypothetical protein
MYFGGENTKLNGLDLDFDVLASAYMSSLINFEEQNKSLSNAV